MLRQFVNKTIKDILKRNQELAKIVNLSKLSYNKL